MSDTTPAVSVIVPFLNERETLTELVEGVQAHLGRTHEILLIDDGSTDGSTEVARGLAESHAGVRLLRLRRNLGKTRALAVGVAAARGATLITMDADLQDDPKELPRLLAALDEGLDLVVGWKQKRQDPWHKTFPSHVYNGGISALFGLPLHDVNCGFKVMRAPVMQAVPLHGEMHRMIAVWAAQAGWRVGELPVEHHPRRYGQSKYGFERFARGAVDVLTVWFLSRYAERPAHFLGGLGLLLLGAGVGLALLSVLGSLFGLGDGWLFALGVALIAAGPPLLGLGLVAELLVAQTPERDPLTDVAEQVD